MQELKPIIESKNFIVLDKYTKIEQGTNYQSETDLEKELIEDLIKQGYEYQEIKTHKNLLLHLKMRLEELNNIKFTNSEWQRFLEEYLDKQSDNVVEKTRKLHDDFVYDFVFDDGHIENIYLLDK